MAVTNTDPIPVEELQFPHGAVMAGCHEDGRQVHLNLDGLPIKHTDDYLYVQARLTQEDEPGSGRHAFVPGSLRLGRLLLKDDLTSGEFGIEVRPLREYDRRTPHASTLATGDWDFMFGKCIALVAVDRSSYTRC